MELSKLENEEAKLAKEKFLSAEARFMRWKPLHRARADEEWHYGSRFMDNPYPIPYPKSYRKFPW
ncbi:MAG: hypothetical protein ACLTS6_15035 [Anaerobutyricum sp.]